ncbi:MAG: riboflavin synthase [Candidatus Aminicenantia bacterium]
MFTGIIDYLGIVKSSGKGKKELVVLSPEIFPTIPSGESLAINGVCLTLVKKEKELLYFYLSQETLEKTNLGLLKPGSKVNLEKPLTLNTPLSGHLVSGHIDGTGKVMKIIRRGHGKRITFSFPRELRKYIIPKGSIALNGVSLTVASLADNSLEVELIPTTLEKTNLDQLKSGDIINIECDLIGKYLAQWFSKRKGVHF